MKFKALNSLCIPHRENIYCFYYVIVLSTSSIKPYWKRKCRISARFCHFLMQYLCVR